MKSVKFLLAIFTAAVVMASCATTQGVSDEDFDGENTRRIGNRVYVDDPYYGTVVLERDPFTGRYYDVTYGYGGLRSPYNTWNRGYRTYPRYYRNNNNNGRGTIQRPAQREVPVNREEARKKILGN
jgi:hypothetical protein